MIVAHIRYSDGHDTSVVLNSGLNSFGTDLACDVVLPQSAALRGKFNVDCGAEGATVVVEDGVELKIRRASGDNIALDPTTPFQLQFGDILKLEDLSIELEGLVANPSGGHLSGPASVLRRAARGTAFMGSITVLCGAMYWTASTGLKANAQPSTSMESAPGASLKNAPAPASALADASRPAIMAELKEIGFSPELLTSIGSGYSATFFVADMKQRDELMMHLEKMPVDIAPRIILDSSILNAVRLSMSLVDKSADDMMVKNGLLTIVGAPSDKTWRKDLIDMLNADIPNLKGVEFSGQSQKWKSEIDDKLVAIWAGRNPYLILSEGENIRPGQEVMDGVVFVGLKDESAVLVSVNGNEKEYVMK